MNKNILGTYEVTSKQLPALAEFGETIDYLNRGYGINPWCIEQAQDIFYAMLIVHQILSDERNGECILSKLGPAVFNRAKQEGSTGITFTITEENYDSLEELISVENISLVDVIIDAIKYEIIEKAWQVNFNPQTEQEAIDSGMALAKRLDDRIGGGWKFNAWENLGWHFKATHGTVAVYPTSNSPDAKWHALISDEIGDTSFGAIQWSDKETYNTPEAAVKGGLKQVAEHVKKCKKILEHNTSGTNLTFPI